MDQARDEIRSAGGDVVAVFQYRAEPTRNFCRRREVELDCLGDRRREAYAAVGLEQGSLKEYLGPQMAGRMLRAARSGNLIGNPTGGDVSQRPGTFVVAADGRVALAHYNRDSSDNPTNDAVLDAVRGAAGGRAPASA
ncbi:MAG TPA: peroxiredoxin-like family protein [Thermoleophilaceae bacterium]|nr:peroxiredoxin-like family protein [Thermoleophilaceae bacterium]